MFVRPQAIKMESQNAKDEATAAAATTTPTTTMLSTTAPDEAACDESDDNNSITQTSESKSKWPLIDPVTDAIFLRHISPDMASESFVIFYSDILTNRIRSLL